MGWHRAAFGAVASLQPAGAWVGLALGDDDKEDSGKIGPRRVVRIVRATQREAGAAYRRVAIKTKDDAEQIAARIAGHRLLAAQLRTFSGAITEPLAAWTAEQLMAGTLRILWRYRQPLTIGATPHAPQTAAPSSPRPGRAPPAPVTATLEDSTFPPDVDASAIARVLRDAARDGVPFCEECIKEAEARNRAGVEAA